ncbi:MAG: hypothetical protein OHK0038_18080 [Flammeovirgaceae bacterium]
MRFSHLFKTTSLKLKYFNLDVKIVIYYEILNDFNAKKYKMIIHSENQILFQLFYRKKKPCFLEARLFLLSQN